MRVPSGAIAATLGEHVGDILLLRAGEQMRRVHTAPIVASVADQETVRNLAIGDLEAETVGSDLNVGVPRSQDERAIAVSEGRGGPVPALIGVASVNMRPEAIFSSSVSVRKGHPQSLAHSTAAREQIR